ncbi:hypothetical protein AGLY_017835 [Aphis glycines]|uniref:Uncharacterized protein n=1 Tax=Aphis glycines TaxID=307491 RepID=A0A6G0SVT3_APHGL|nr:hypothetical protein AGLY_017835 [Aphis glycines]
MKTVGKCSLLKVISIKDIRFAVETTLKKSLNNSKNTYFFKNSTSTIDNRYINIFLYLNIDLVGFRFYVRFAVFGHFFFVYLNYFENCWEMFTFNGYKHQGHSICSRKPPSKFVIGAFFRLVMLYKETKKKNFRKSIIDLVDSGFIFAVFGHFFLFISIILKTVGKCSLLTVISIKDIRFAVENHPQNLPFSVILFLFISIILKTVGECSLLNGYSIKDIRFCIFKNHPQSIKDIRFAVENHPQIDWVGFRFYVRFAVFCHFFFVYLNYSENCWEMFTFNGYKHQGHSICSRKPPS